MPAPSSSTPGSQKPYLIRALHEWCTDQGYTPYIAVFVDEKVEVPMQYVRDQHIVLSMAWESTSKMVMGNDLVTFDARFGGIVHSVIIPVSNILGIYSKETGQGMGFDFEPTTETAETIERANLTAPTPQPAQAAPKTVKGLATKKPTPAPAKAATSEPSPNPSSVQKTTPPRFTIVK